MSNFVHRFIDSPHIYYPQHLGRIMRRISMYDGEKEVAFVDLFVENGWAHFIFVYVDPMYRTEETIWHYIKNAFQFDLGVTQIYWLGIVPALTPYLYRIAEERPDLTFAATGDVRIILNK